MANTTNYNWETPDDTDLVKDGAAAIRTLGNSIDTTTKNLNPETTTGDIAYRSATANTNTRLAIGSAGQVLTVAAGVPSWATPSDQTPLTTKGDVFTFSTVDARLGVGANGTVLTADSAETTGLKWATPAGGGGKVLQVVQATSTSTTSNSTSTLADATGLSVTITPSLASSKVLVMFNFTTYASATDQLNSLKLRIFRGATEIHNFGAEYNQIRTAVVKQLPAFAVYLDSPSTTSATTYKIQFANYINGAFVAINDPQTTMVSLAMEIGA